MFSFKKRNSPLEEQQVALRIEIERAEQELSVAYSNFQIVTEPELIDFYIYQVNAIQMKHKFLLREWKKLDQNIKNTYSENPEEFVC